MNFTKRPCPKCGQIINFKMVADVSKDFLAPCCGTWLVIKDTELRFADFNAPTEKRIKRLERNVAELQKYVCKNAIGCIRNYE